VRWSCKWYQIAIVHNSLYKRRRLLYLQAPSYIQVWTVKTSEGQGKQRPSAVASPDHGEQALDYSVRSNRVAPWSAVDVMAMAHFCLASVWVWRGSTAICRPWSKPNLQPPGTSMGAGIKNSIFWPISHRLFNHNKRHSPSPAEPSVIGACLFVCLFARFMAHSLFLG
jgi:hypothetical protein